MNQPSGVVCGWRSRLISFLDDQGSKLKCVKRWLHEAMPARWKMEHSSCVPKPSEPRHVATAGGTRRARCGPQRGRGTARVHDAAHAV
eukprot:3268811-Pleurochrysis_carterae.AAC.1